MIKTQALHALVGTLTKSGALTIWQTHLFHSLAETHTRSEALKAVWQTDTIHALIETPNKSEALKTQH